MVTLFNMWLSLQKQNWYMYTDDLSLFTNAYEKMTYAT